MVANYWFRTLFLFSATSSPTEQSGHPPWYRRHGIQALKKRKERKKRKKDGKEKKAKGSAPFCSQRRAILISLSLKNKTFGFKDYVALFGVASKPRDLWSTSFIERGALPDWLELRNAASKYPELPGHPVVLEKHDGIFPIDVFNYFFPVEERRSIIQKERGKQNWNNTNFVSRSCQRESQMTMTFI